jgi:hypothetical protein
MSLKLLPSKLFIDILLKGSIRYLFSIKKIIDYKPLSVPQDLRNLNV